MEEDVGTVVKYNIHVVHVSCKNVIESVKIVFCVDVDPPCL